MMNHPNRSRRGRSIERRYVRFGTLPESGQSRNHMSGALEEGVSVYAVIRVGREWRLDGALGSYYMLKDSGRPCFEVKGREIGRGSDGEPLLAEAEIVRRSRISPVGDCWEKLPIPSLGNTESIYRHCLSGEIWCVIAAYGDWRCKAEDFERLLRQVTPRRSAEILVEYAEALRA